MYAHNYTWISLVHSEVELERKTIPTNEELFIPFNGEHTKMFVIDQDDEENEPYGTENVRLEIQNQALKMHAGAVVNHLFEKRLREPYYLLPYTNLD